MRVSERQETAAHAENRKRLETGGGELGSGGGHVKPYRRMPREDKREMGVRELLPLALSFSLFVSALDSGKGPEAAPGMFRSRVRLTILHRARDVVNFVEKTLTQLRIASTPSARSFPWLSGALYHSFLLLRAFGA